LIWQLQTAHLRDLRVGNGVVFSAGAVSVLMAICTPCGESEGSLNRMPAGVKVLIFIVKMRFFPEGMHAATGAVRETPSV
jgi:hypothetical protein